MIVLAQELYQASAVYTKWSSQVKKVGFAWQVQSSKYRTYSSLLQTAGSILTYKKKEI
jgi:hypothetical protein